MKDKLETCCFSEFGHTKDKCGNCHDLLPCPFCGSDNIIRKISPMRLKRERNHYISCVKCGITTDLYNTIIQVTKAWNKRT